MKHPRLIDEGSVWILVAPLCLWAAHFLLCYWLAAVRCAGGEGLTGVRWAVAALTLAALAVLAALAAVARHRYGGELIVNEEITGNDTAARKRFLGHVALLLCALGAVAVVFTATPALVFDRCW